MEDRSRGLEERERKEENESVMELFTYLPPVHVLYILALGPNGIQVAISLTMVSFGGKQCYDQIFNETI